MLQFADDFPIFQGGAFLPKNKNIMTDNKWRERRVLLWGRVGGGRGSTMEQACFLLNRHFLLRNLLSVCGRGNMSRITLQLPTIGFDEGKT